MYTISLHSLILQYINNTLNSFGWQILHMFHRKVHPENSTGAQKCDKYQKKKTMNEGSEEDILMIQPKRAELSKENYTRQYKIQPNPFQFTLGCEEDSSENKEHWIKTDADCKYKVVVLFATSIYHMDPLHPLQNELIASYPINCSF